METRKMQLPEGWYPHDSVSAERAIKQWDTLSDVPVFHPAGGIGPHAGWTFSGELSWRLVRNIPSDTEIVIIAGGHLLPNHPHRVLNYKQFETPFGLLSIDSEAVNDLCGDFLEDHDPDNTVEIYLPLIKYLLPDVTILPVRLSPTIESEKWARQCADYCKKNRRNAFFVGSTDLSHYGSRFQYTKFGDGHYAKECIRNIDSAFLGFLSDQDLFGAQSFIEEHQCACSGGAAIGSAAFSEEMEKLNGMVIDHYYSYDVIEDSDSFVGYGSIIYS